MKKKTWRPIMNYLVNTFDNFWYGNCGTIKQFKYAAKPSGNAGYKALVRADGKILSEIDASPILVDNPHYLSSLSQAHVVSGGYFGGQFLVFDEPEKC